MGKRAVVRPPGGTFRSVVVRGICPPAHVEKSPIRLTVRAGDAERAVALGPDNSTFDVKLEGSGSELVLEVDRTVRLPPDVRDLGVAITSIDFYQ